MLLLVSPPKPYALFALGYLNIEYETTFFCLFVDSFSFRDHTLQSSR